MRRPAFLTVVLMTAALLLAPTAPATAAPYCGLTWGSLTKADAQMSTAPVTGVRSGRHACFDRLVVDVRGDVGGYTVRYVTHVRSDGSGAIIPTRGGARLQITVNDPAYDASGRPTYVPRNTRALTDVTGYRTFRQVVWAGSFEGYSSVGLGVRARLPFRVLTLDGPGTASRLVIDVAHRW